MKFEYEDNQVSRECVAYVDDDGDIVIKDVDGDTVCLTSDNCLISDYGWRPREAIHKFYPGDKITITF